MPPYTQFTVTHDYNHPPARLYRAWVDADEFARWAWGGTKHNPTAECDVRVGGHYRCYIDNTNRDEWPTARTGMLGFYTRVEPDRALAYTVHWDAWVGYNVGVTDCPDEHITIEFELRPDGCRVSYTHMGIPDDETTLKAHEQATRDVLAFLAKHLDCA